MGQPPHSPPPLTHGDTIPWQEHPRYPGIFFKALVTRADNPFVSVGLVRIPSGGVIGIHNHPNEIETIYGLGGEGVFTLGAGEMPFRAGQIVCVPIGMEHGMRNEMREDVDLMTIFTPPLF